MASSIFKMVLMRIFGCKYFVASGTRLLPPVNEVCGNVICLQVCVCPQGGAIPACIAGGIPACLATGLQGVLSQYALQVVSQHALQQVLGEVSRPTPKGKVEGDLVQAHSQGGS